MFHTLTLDVQQQLRNEHLTMLEAELFRLLLRRHVLQALDTHNLASQSTRKELAENTLAVVQLQTAIQVTTEVDLPMVMSQQRKEEPASPDTKDEDQETGTDCSSEQEPVIAG